MKKVLTALCLGFLCLGSTLSADDRERAVQFEKLPKAAIAFVEQYFSKDQVLFATEETEFLGKEYNVMLENNISLQFDKEGKWTKVECRMNPIPQDLIPNEIQTFIEQKFPQMSVREIQRDKRGWEVELMNGIGLEFDQRFNLVDYDD